MELLGFLFAFIIGITLGMLGGGGSILTVPVFVYVLHYDPKLAIAMSLPVVGATSLVGAIGHWRAGNVRLGEALFFGVFAVTGAFFAARYSGHFQGRTQLFLLGAVMLAASVMMLRDSFRAPIAATEVPSPVNARISVAVVALLVGALTGTVGIGGGFLWVPTLVLLARVPMRQAVGTSLLVITMNALAAFAGQPRLGQIPLGFVAAFAAIAMAGILAGTRLQRHVEQRMLKRAFAVFLLVIASFVLWQNRALL